MIATKTQEAPARTNAAYVLGTVDRRDFGIPVSRKLRDTFNGREFTTLQVLHVVRDCGSVRQRKFVFQTGNMHGGKFEWNGGLVLTLEAGAEREKSVPGEAPPYSCAAFTKQESDGKAEGGLIEADKTILYEDSSSGFHSNDFVYSKENPLRVMYQSLEALRNAFNSSGERDVMLLSEHGERIRNGSILATLARVADHLCKRSENGGSLRQETAPVSRR
jgi:hypothetical protein